MRQRYLVNGFRRSIVRKLENALNSLLAMDVKEGLRATAQERDPILFSNGGSPLIATCITRLKSRIAEMKALRG